MIKAKVFGIFVIMALLGLILACASNDEFIPLTSSHIQAEGEDLRFCLDCHDGDEDEFNFRQFIHILSFAEDHRLIANHSSRICYKCHKSSYCSECHGIGIELKPSIKYQTDVQRRLPHRGDYLSRHRIDGRMDPVSCYRCHGNQKTSKVCKSCHG